MQRFVLKLLIALIAGGLSNAVTAQANNLEVAQATLSAYSTTSADVTPFETISFQAGFPAGVTPNVFILTPEFGSGGAGGTGDDPCQIRIKNITNAGFDAVCLEPHTENRNSSAVTFDYIAIAPGQVDIPTTTASENVTFFSGCETVSNQQYGPSCTDCSGAQGFQGVSFPMGLFSSSPALLTQIVTTNNTLAAAAGTAPAGETEFVSAAVNSIASTGFNVSVERFEAGIDGLDEDEDICYLAVESDGCKTLDLSSTNGPGATVNFEAVVNNSTAGANQGHDNTARSSANFSMGCFSTPPLVAANMRLRRGNNGGFLRRDSLSATAATFLVDEDRVADGERSHIPEPISALAFASAFTNPVTLSRVKINQFGRRVTFDWQTSAESFHLGFHIWGETRDGWVQLNRRLIPGVGADTNKAHSYTQTIRLSREQANEVLSYGISAVDTSGLEEFYGAFHAGEEYGEGDTREAIDWNDTRRQFDAKMQANGYTKINDRWRRLNKRRTESLRRRQARRDADALELSFDASGMHQVSMAEILLLRPQWEGRNVDILAVTLNGKAVTRSIVSEDKKISADDRIILNVAAPQGEDDLYLDQYVYRIGLSRSLVRQAQYVDGPHFDPQGLSAVGLSKIRLTRDKQYSAAQTTGSPWYDAQLFAFSSPVSSLYSFSLSEQEVIHHPGRLSFTVFGGLDLPGDEKDHHIQIRVNDELLYDHRFDGLTSNSVALEIPQGILRLGENTVEVRLPGDTGLLADIVHVVEIDVFTPRTLERDTIVSLPKGDENQAQILPNELDRSLTVFGFANNGDFRTLKSTISSDGLVFYPLPLVENSASQLKVNYLVASPENLPLPARINEADLPDEELYKVVEQVDLMVVAHPNFIGSTLDDFVKFKQDMGASVHTIDWLSIVAKFGHGNNTPQALDNYLSSIESSLRPKHVLLVGGHTFDYKDLLNQGTVSFIPAHYREVGIFQYTPSDNVFADIDEDNLPDLAIGRWPVRTQADLEHIVNKTISWQESSTGNALASDVLLIAQDKDGRNLDFESLIEGSVTPNLDHQSGLLGVRRVFMGELNGESPIQQARDSIKDTINAGARLVSYAGHASSSGWGFQGIVNTSTIQELNNQGAPTVVMPLACYTTDYQSLSTNTLAHQWMFAGQQGAVAIHGATSLGEYRNNGLFAEKVMKASQSANTLGEAILRAKRTVAPVNQILHNWALLGDPSIPAP